MDQSEIKTYYGLELPGHSAAANWLSQRGRVAETRQHGRIEEACNGLGCKRARVVEGIRNVEPATPDRSVPRDGKASANARDREVATEHSGQDS